MIDEKHFEEIWLIVDRIRLARPEKAFKETSALEEALAEALAVVIDKHNLTYEQGTMPSLLRRLNTWLYKTVAKGYEEGEPQYLLLDYARKHYPNDCKYLDEKQTPASKPLPVYVDPPRPKRSRYMETGRMPLNEYLAAGLGQEFDDGPLTARELIKIKEKHTCK